MSEREKFEKWWSSLPLSYRMTFQTNEHHWAGFQATLSTRKAYGYGIVDKDGKAESEIVMSESSANLFQKAMTEHTGEWSARGPFRPVELFYEDSGMPQDALDGGWTAVGISKYAKGLENERNDLVAACRFLRHKTSAFVATNYESWRNQIQKIDSILAKYPEAS